MRAALAVVFLFGQTAIAFHHHDDKTANQRIVSSSRRTETVAANDADCLLCAAQGMPSSSASASPAVAALPIEVAALVLPSVDAPRAALVARVSDRSPPVL